MHFCFRDKLKIPIVQKQSLFSVKYHQMHWQGGAPTDPGDGAYDAPPDSLKSSDCQWRRSTIIQRLREREDNWPNLVYDPILHCFLISGLL